MKIGALILAGGEGRRMGTVSKATLRSDGATFLEKISLTCQKESIDDVLVVLGPTHFKNDVAEATRLDLPYILNSEANTGGMASSVSTGISLLKLKKLDWLFLWPVDIPFVSHDTLKELVAKCVKDSVVVPHYQGRAGHPPLIADCYFNDFEKSHLSSLGAKGVMRSIQHYVPVDVDDPMVLKDIDVPTDLK